MPCGSHSGAREEYGPAALLLGGFLLGLLLEPEDGDDIFPRNVD